jgi:alkylation response protein AidB-like acyl-CoA dehydrogenase
VRFAFTDEQRELAAAVRDMLDKECSSSRLREAWAGDGFDSRRWLALAEMGVLGLLVSEDQGGLGLGDTDAVLVWQECGRAAVPEPVLDTTVAAPLLGEATADVISLIHPLHPHALAADHADQILSLREDRGGTVLLDARDPAVELRPVPSVDASRHLFKIRSGRGPMSSTTSARGQNELGVGIAEVERAVDRAVVAHAAALCGLGERMLDLTVAYVKERHQFGRPIGSFQAVKHHCADALLALELARPLVWRAAWSIEHGDPAVSVHASMAKARASEAALEVARRALQCHAAIGYTTEYELHMYMKRAWVWARAWGDPAHHYDRIASATVDPEESADG